MHTVFDTSSPRSDVLRLYQRIRPSTIAASDLRAIVLFSRAVQLCNVAVFAFHLCSCLSNAWSVSGTFAFAESGRCRFSKLHHLTEIYPLLDPGSGGQDCALTLRSRVHPGGGVVPPDCSTVSDRNLKRP